MKKLVTAAAVALIFLAGCAKSTPVDRTEYPEYYVACYKGEKFVKMDDDCHDDGLTVGPRPTWVKVKPSFKPQPTSGGMKTTGPLKPATGTGTKKTTTTTGRK
ncbi:MAG TPA: hypothetical protein VK899_05680 [Gemmatimonadales bacterium]|nr:hypothetical protein [Gemmatimonadales bacterium]